MTLVIAHRAGWALEAGGGLVGIAAARSEGADWVELEVRRTADDVLVVHHDARLPDGRALVDLAADELDETVPLLITALDSCDGLGVTLEVRNDPDDPDYDDEHRVSEAVAGLILSRDAVDGLVVSSFNVEAVARIEAIEPAIATAWMCFDLPDPAQAVERCVAHGLDGLHAYVSYVDRSLVRRCHEAGLHLHAWVVDDADRIGELAVLGVDGIVTDRPAVARRAVDDARAAR